MTIGRFALVAAFFVAATSLGAAERTWTGVISDSACGGTHEAAAEGADKMSDHDCTLACVKGGSTYVLVADGKIYKIANQNFDGLAAHAGTPVSVTGDLEGDAVKVTAIVQSKK